MKEREDLTGRVFGRLTVVRHLYKGVSGHQIWECRCTCGAVVEVIKHNLKYTNSCGCLQKELNVIRNKAKVR